MTYKRMIELPDEFVDEIVKTELLDQIQCMHRDYQDLVKCEDRQPYEDRDLAMYVEDIPATILVYRRYCVYHDPDWYSIGRYEL